MDDAGIDLQILSVGPQLPYLDDERHAVEAARFANDLYAGVAQRFGGRYAAFGTLPLPFVDAALAELDRCLGDLGAVGVSLGCSVLGLSLDDQRFEAVWAELDRRKAVVFLHPVGAAGPGMNDYGLTWMIGSQLEDTTAALRLVLSGLIERFPSIRVIVPHLGGTIPFLLQRIEDQAERQRFRQPAVLLIEGSPVPLLRRLWFDTVNEHAPALALRLRLLGR